MCVVNPGRGNRPAQRRRCETLSLESPAAVEDVCDCVRAAYYRAASVGVRSCSLRLSRSVSQVVGWTGHKKSDPFGSPSSGRMCS